MPSGITGRCSTPHDSQPCDEKKLKITSGHTRNATRCSATTKRACRLALPSESQHGN